MMTSSVAGLMTSNFFLSTLSTHLPSMYLEWHVRQRTVVLSSDKFGVARKDLQSNGLLVRAGDRRLQLCEQRHCDVL